MKIAVLGYGTVGKGVYDMLLASRFFEAGPVLVRAGKADSDFKVESIDDIVNDGSVDAVAEVMGGTGAAYDYALAALRAGKHFVTSNKALVAAKGVELNKLASENGAAFLFSAACGGAVPFLHNLELARQNDEIEALGGILNGTTNYMLDRMQSDGLDYSEALREAQALGYAEADPTADVTGLDALRKIMLGCAVAYDVLPVSGLLNEGIDSLTAADVAELRKKGLTCRLVAKGGKNADGSVYAYVQPVLFPADAPECAVKKNFNMAKYIGKNSGQIVFMGQGAGRYPTASAVVRDLECAAIGQREMLKESCAEGAADNASALCRYYVRLPAQAAGKLGCESAEEKDGIAIVLTKPMSVSAMHQFAKEIRESGEKIFFAEI